MLVQILSAENVVQVDAVEVVEPISGQFLGAFCTVLVDRVFHNLSNLYFHHIFCIEIHFFEMWRISSLLWMFVGLYVFMMGTTAGAWRRDDTRGGWCGLVGVMREAWV
eukprot:TRINITY_DN66781_c7_g3_i1.p2 TRINITY_DN66781_c7_g3~~TRINITY_DN66781_c7_g3_i1.p2  ORF type:complete len:108 (+),score=4.86 TRINITY_DN66781_c7_g3_i1:173-496(+)